MNGWWLLVLAVVLVVVGIAWCVLRVALRGVLKSGDVGCRIVNTYFVKDQSERDYFERHVRDSIVGVDWYLATVESGQVVTIDSNKSIISPCSPILWFKQVFAGSYDAWIYSGHSGGPYLGPEDAPIITIEELVKSFQSGRLKFIWFDSCNMGFLESLVMLEGVTEYVVGAPNYYDWHSVLQTNEIYRLVDGDPEELIRVLKAQASVYDRTDVLVELCLYRMGPLGTLWRLYKSHKSSLIHSEDAKIEGDYYDLPSVIRDSRGYVDDGILDEMTRKLEAGLVHYTRCNLCAQSVPESRLAVRFDELSGGSW